LSRQIGALLICRRQSILKVERAPLADAGCVRLSGQLAANCVGRGRFVMETYSCSQCKHIKPLAEFNKWNRHKNGHRSYCRECQAKRNADYRKSHKAALAKYQRQYRLLHPSTNNKRGCKVKSQKAQKVLPESLPDALKRCRRCGLVKQKEEFRKCRANKSGLQGICKECCKRQVDPALALFRNAKSRAKRKALIFELTIDDISIPAVCPLLGIPLIVGNGKHSPASPTLDRIDNRKGYIRENVWVISYRANMIKQDATASELLQMGEALMARQREP